MSEPTYTLTLTESDRQDMARALGKFVQLLACAHPTVDASTQTAPPPKHESPSGGTQSARAVLSPPSQAPAAAPSPTPVAPRDRWARDRKGNEVPMPDGYVAREVTIWKAEEKPSKKATGKPYLKVTWQGERGYIDANCFDEKLFPWIISRISQKTTLYLVKPGEYLNVVGVRA